MVPELALKNSNNIVEMILPTLLAEQKFFADNIFLFWPLQKMTLENVLIKRHQLRFKHITSSQTKLIIV